MRGSAMFLLLALGGCSPAAPDAREALVFHHVHLRVADPAVAMNRYARANGCQKLILQGVGVGVRCADRYLLFDRNTQPADRPVARVAVTVDGSGETAQVRARVASDDPEAAGRWLATELGSAASDALTFVSQATAAQFPYELSHVSFGARDPAPILARLDEAGVRFVSRSDDAAVIDGPAGLVIEIVRDLGIGPDLFWCPMHPDERSPTGGTCRLCGMTYVPIPPPVFGDYDMAVGYDQANGRGTISIRITNPESGDAVTRFQSVHERLLHLFIIGRDLDTFAHVHPELQADGRFLLEFSWPKPDTYALYADFHPAGGTPQLLQDTFVTADFRGSPFPPLTRPPTDASAPKTVGDVRVSLAVTDLVAGREATLAFALTEDGTAAPVGNLQPYLGAPGHLMIVSADLADVVHSHPSDVTSTGPLVTFAAVFPRAGIYKMWMQFQRSGDIVHTVPFVVDVAAR